MSIYEEQKVLTLYGLVGECRAEDRDTQEAGAQGGV